MVTIGDVKAAAQKQWPNAGSLNVQLVPKTASTGNAYRLSVYGTHNRLLTRITAPTLSQLCDRLKSAQDSKSESTEVGDEELEVPTRSVGETL
jgi:hypothetical protein